jgi:hypothetical protein
LAVFGWMKEVFVLIKICALRIVNECCIFVKYFWQHFQMVVVVINCEAV